MSGLGDNAAISGLGKKFDGKKVRISKKIELFSILTFFLIFFGPDMEAIGLQKWQTTHLKLISNDEECTI